MITPGNHPDVDEGNIGVSRAYLISQLQRLLDYGVKKVFTKQTPSLKKIKWARISISAACAAAGILKDTDMDEIQKRLLAIEAKLV